MSKGDTTLEVQNETSVEYTPHAASFQLVLAGLPATGSGYFPVGACRTASNGKLAEGLEMKLLVDSYYQ